MSAFENLPAPRADGKCIDCEKNDAETRDDLFCLGCVRKRIWEDNPFPKRPSDRIGRKERCPKTLGGMAEMRSD